jgi:orotidine-5'-phosphate decarboxylase
MSVRLIVALDVPEFDPALPLVDRLPPAAGIKVGLELFSAEGPRPVEVLRERGRSVFLDLKLHDIPRTVSRAVQAAAGLGVQLLTVHASGGRAMLEAAAAAANDAGPDGPKVLAVTVLTSLDRSDLEETGIPRAPADHALSLARLAIGCGIHGVVCSVHEAAALRSALGPAALIVTPGIRPSTGDAGDQKRVSTPADAVRAGASHIVVGRPILDAPDPQVAALAILAELDGSDALRG